MGVYSKCTRCTAAARAIWRQLQSILQCFHKKCTKCTKCTEVGLRHMQILQMHQVHDSCTSYMTTVTVNLAVFSQKMHEMHQMHQSRSMPRVYTTNAPGARQLHELYDDCYSQSCSVFSKNARKAPNAPKKVYATRIYYKCTRCTAAARAI